MRRLREIAHLFFYIEEHNGGGGGGISPSPWRKKTFADHAFGATNALMFTIPFICVAVWAYLIAQALVS